MKIFISALIIFGALVIFKKTKGGCLGEDDDNTITNCNGTYKSGNYIKMNFNKINRSCSCSVNALFSGDLIVTVFKDASDHGECRTEVTVSSQTTTTVFNCEIQYPSAVRFDVNTNETVVNIKTYYTAGYTSGNFSFCMGINQNGGLGGIVSVTCGNLTKTTTKTTTTAETTTTTTTTVTKTATTTILTSNPISESRAVTSTTVTAKPTYQGINSFCTCNTTVLSLQISLAIFVVISVVLSVLTSYLFVRLKFRSKSVNEKDNNGETDTQRMQNETNTDSYTELGLVNMAVEPENQYESLTRE